jgi:hypothetical protein
VPGKGAQKERRNVCRARTHKSSGVFSCQKRISKSSGNVSCRTKRINPLKETERGLRRRSPGKAGDYPLLRLTLLMNEAFPATYWLDLAGDMDKMKYIKKERKK